MPSIEPAENTPSAVTVPAAADPWLAQAIAALGGDAPFVVVVDPSRWGRVHMQLRALEPVWAAPKSLRVAWACKGALAKAKWVALTGKPPADVCFTGVDLRAACSGDVPKALSKRRELLGLVFAEQRVDHAVEISLEDLGQTIQREVDTVIRDPPLRVVVGADAFAAVARAHQRFAQPGLLGVRGLAFTLEQA